MVKLKVYQLEVSMPQLPFSNQSVLDVSMSATQVAAPAGRIGLRATLDMSEAGLFTIGEELYLAEITERLTAAHERAEQRRLMAEAEQAKATASEERAPVAVGVN